MRSPPNGTYGVGITGYVDRVSHAAFDVVAVSETRKQRHGKRLSETHPSPSDFMHASSVFDELKSSTA